jgi:hypothetical protein
MAQVEIRIADARAAASTFAALGRLSGGAGLPLDQSEFSARLARATGRAKPLAIALAKFVEVSGFAALHEAIGQRAPAASETSAKAFDDAQAAAMVSAIDFDGIDRTAIKFASSGLY